MNQKGITIEWGSMQVWASHCPILIPIFVTILCNFLNGTWSIQIYLSIILGSYNMDSGGMAPQTIGLSMEDKPINLSIHNTLQINALIFTSKLNIINLFMCKCTFSPYILTFFHFGPYILILPLLVPKSINACYFRPFHQSTDGNS